MTQNQLCMKYYILMADIIASSEKNQIELMNNFKELVSEINKTFKDEILSPLTITLGDEFQCVLKDLKSSTDIILQLEENIIHKKLNFKLRYVLNQGSIETPINELIAYEMLGTGLTDARYKLNLLKAEKHRFIISIDNNFKNDLLKDAFIVFENIIDKWSMVNEFEIVSNFIKFKDYKMVSKIMGKTRSQLWKREKTLNIESYNSIKNIIILISKS